jgi:hypothetical protein
VCLTRVFIASDERAEGEVEQKIATKITRIMARPIGHTFCRFSDDDDENRSTKIHDDVDALESCS